MKIIGITGTSGSGKTTICNILDNKYDAFIIDCDKITRQMLTKKNKYFDTIVETFGTEILQTNGDIDRKKLANIIYNSKEKREKLNEITNKYIFPEIINIIKDKEKSKNIIVIDAPLLIESKLNNLCDIVVSVLAKEETKVKRICNRDNVEENIAKLRLNIQQADQFYIQNSDYNIINNDNNIDKIEQDIKNILSNIV